MNDKALSFGTARDAPAYFAGRRKELETLRKRLRYIRETSDPRGGMVLIDGVQGVGKTQLVAQFAAEAAEGDHRTAVLNVPVADLANPLALFAAIVGALGGNDRIAKEIADAADCVTSAKIACVGVSAERPSPLGLSINAMLARSKRGGLWQGRTLVVAVDEIQAIGVEARRTLQALHEGVYECPIHAGWRRIAARRHASGRGHAGGGRHDGHRRHLAFR